MKLPFASYVLYAPCELTLIVGEQNLSKIILFEQNLSRIF